MVVFIGQVVEGWWCFCLIMFIVALLSDATVRPVVKCYDGWIGFYHDVSGHKVYYFPLPFIGFVVIFP